MGLTKEQRLDIINKILDEFASTLSNELVPIFDKRVRNAVIESTLMYYLNEFMTPDKNLKSNIYILIVMKSIDIAKITRASADKDKLIKIHDIALPAMYTVLHTK